MRNLKKKMLNIFHDFIPNRTILCGAQHARWFNDKIKKRMTSIVPNVNLQSLATILFMLLL